MNTAMNAAMNTAMNTAMTAMNTSAHTPLDHDLAEDLHRALTLVEDWLLHASPETLDELADFAYGPTHHGHDHLRWIIDLLGEAAARLRPAPPPPTPEPTTADRGPSR
jgi:hypothetical protein